VEFLATKLWIEFLAKRY